MPLPSQRIVEDLPMQDIPEPAIDQNLTDRKAAKVTDNAFEGAFGMIATPSLTAQETDMVEHQRLYG